MTVCVGGERGASCDNSDRQQEAYINERERDGTEEEYQ